MFAELRRVVDYGRLHFHGLEREKKNDAIYEWIALLELN